MRRSMSKIASVLLALAVIGACASSPTRTATEEGPRRGTLVIVGGGRIGPALVHRFIDLAGGVGAPIVVIPTAIGDSSYDQDCGCAQFLRDAGATHVTVLHAKDRREADDERFVAPIR